MKHLIQSSLPEYTGETIVRPARFGSVISASFGTSTHLIFLNLNGTISVWNGGAGTTAQVQATTPGAVYTGLAIAGNLLYAANGAQNRIDVFNGSFAPPTLAQEHSLIRSSRLDWSRSTSRTSMEISTLLTREVSPDSGNARYGCGERI
jgi:hypothetical protein